jgi:hypothetical protein
MHSIYSDGFPVEAIACQPSGATAAAEPAWQASPASANAAEPMMRIALALQSLIARSFPA